MKTLLPLLLVASMAAIQGFGQIKFPVTEITPQSPSAASFTRYGEIPVDLSTGVPKIDVPIFTLKAGDIVVPISMSYHASGIKVRDISSIVGLGWNLNIGGIVTRTVLGSVDEITNKNTVSDSAQVAGMINNALKSGAYNAAILSVEMFNELRLRQGTDCYSDRYYYSLGNGESGTFRQDFATGELKMMPYSNVKPILEPNRNIEIVAADGNHYYFKRNYHDIWHLTKIVSNNKSDSVIFYSHPQRITSTSSNDIGRSKGTDAFITLDNTCETRLAIRDRSNRDDISYIPLAQQDEEIVMYDSIVSSTTTIKITYANDRQDRLFSHSSPKSRINKIEVVHKSSRNPAIVITFFSSYFGTSQFNKRLRLDSLHLGVTDVQRYLFSYNTLSLPDYPDAVLPNFRYAEDYWGYCNGGAYNTTTIPLPFLKNGAYMFVDSTYAQACSLQQITYPTGGKTVFEFQSNKINPIDGITTSDGLIGGLRVKRIINHPGSGGRALIKSYQYNKPLYAYYITESELFNYEETTVNTYTGSFGCRFLNFTSLTVTMSNTIKPLIGTSLMPLVYEVVTEFSGDELGNTGKTVYLFRKPRKAPELTYPGLDYAYLYANAFQYDYGLYQSKLEQQNEYKFENGAYKTIKITAHEYDNFKIHKFKTGFNLGSMLRFYNFDDPSNEMGAFERYLESYNADFLYSLAYSNTWGYTDVLAPIKTIVTEVTDNGNIVTTTDITYNELMQVVGRSTKTSQGEFANTTVKFPNEFKDVEPYKTMVARNNLNPVVEQAEYRQNKAVRSIKTNFSQWTPNLIAPSVIDDTWGSRNTEPRIQFHKYDNKGNILAYSKETGLSSLFIYGYRKTYPIAELITPDHNIEFAYTSFEDEADDSNRKWTVQGTYRVIADATAPIGKRHLNLSSSSLFKDNLTPSTIYIVSYCYRGKEPSVVGPTSKQDAEYRSLRNGWTRVSFKISGTQSIKISDGDFLDDARIYPMGTLLTTYTFDPIVGVTSVTDPNGFTNYFEYDSQNRLIRVTDNAGNVVKQHTYHLKK